MKFSKRQLSFFFTIVLAAGLFVGAKKLLADANSNLAGYAWSSNIGWIKLNNCTDPANASTCTGSGYGVNILPAAPGTISGYAWSSNIGWITFNDPSCPLTGCTPGARADWANKNSDGSVNIKGWARTCSVYASGCSGALKNQAALGICNGIKDWSNKNVYDTGDTDTRCEWDGYIALDATTAGGTGGNWGWKINTDKSITGFAWGSEVIGWVKSVSLSIGNSSGLAVTLTANPTTIKRGDTSTLTVIATNIDGPNACSGLPSPITMAKNADGSWTATQVVTPGLTTEYTVNCTKGGTVVQAKATVTVTYFKTPADDGTGCPTAPCSKSSGGSGGPGGNGGYCTLDNPQFAWDSIETSCTITRQGGGTQTVAGSSKAAGGTLGTDGLYYFTTNLGVTGTTTNYTLKCGSGTTALTYTNTINRCTPDYSIVVTPDKQTLIPGAIGKMVATYTVSINPIQGFVDPVTLSIGSWPANIPASKVSAFTPTIITSTGGIFSTSVFTVTLDTKELKTSTTYTPVIIKGVSSAGITRQASVSVGSDVKKQPIYSEF